MKEFEVTIPVEFYPRRCKDPLDDKSLEEIEIIFTFAYTPGCPGDRWTPADPGDMELVHCTTYEVFRCTVTGNRVPNMLLIDECLPLSLHIAVAEAKDAAEMEAWECAVDDALDYEDDDERYNPSEEEMYDY